MQSPTRKIAVFRNADFESRPKSFGDSASNVTSSFSGVATPRHLHPQAPCEASSRHEIGGMFDCQSGNDRVYDLENPSAIHSDMLKGTRASASYGIAYCHLKHDLRFDFRAER